MCDLEDISLDPTVETPEECVQATVEELSLQSLNNILAVSQRIEQALEETLNAVTTALDGATSTLNDCTSLSALEELTDVETVLFEMMNTAT